MKIMRFSTGISTNYGIIEGDNITVLEGAPFPEIIPTTTYYSLGNVQLLPPCVPSKVVAVGVNYRSHGDEMSHRLPEEPLLFIKPNTSVIGPGEAIIYPPSSRRVDYEGELAVVIGKVARNVPREKAFDYILGYTCLNDVTARDLQARDKQWTRSKSFDTFCPIGPWIENDLNPSHLHLQTRLNSEIKQDTDTGLMIFPVDVLVSFISEVMTLLPGDVIATGTTAGIGPMQPGDTVEVEIESIGILRNPVVHL